MPDVFNAVNNVKLNIGPLFGNPGSDGGAPEFPPVVPPVLSARLVRCVAVSSSEKTPVLPTCQQQEFYNYCSSNLRGT